jgi:hypothetical protein
MGIGARPPKPPRPRLIPHTKRAQVVSDSRGIRRAIHVRGLEDTAPLTSLCCQRPAHRVFAERIEFDIDILDEECQFHLNDASMELSGSDPMGQVSGGKIQLRAMVVKMDPYGNIPNHLEIELRGIYNVQPGTPVRDQWLL